MSGANQIRKYDTETFNDLIRRYYSSLVSFSANIIKSKDAAEDVVQELFVNIWEENIMPDPDTPFRNFLYISVRNRSLNYIRSEKRLKERHEKIEFEEEENYRDYVIEEEIHRKLHEALQKLPERSAKILELSMNGLSQEEIGKQMGISVNSVKSMKAFAIKKLKKILDPLTFIYLISIL